MGVYVIGMERDDRVFLMDNSIRNRRDNDSQWNEYPG